MQLYMNLNLHHHLFNSVMMLGVTMNSLMAYSSRVSTIRRQVRGAMEIALFIQNIQEERAEVALYIFPNQTENNNITLWNKPAVMTTNHSSQPFYYRLPHLSTLPSNPHRNRMGIQERFSQTDRALEEVPSWPQGGRQD